MNITLSMGEIMVLVAGLPVKKSITIKEAGNIKIELIPEGSLNEMIRENEERRTRMKDSEDPDDFDPIYIENDEGS
jgi:hypothetical protein